MVPPVAPRGSRFTAFTVRISGDPPAGRVARLAFRRSQWSLFPLAHPAALPPVAPPGSRVVVPSGHSSRSPYSRRLASLGASLCEGRDSNRRKTVAFASLGRCVFQASNPSNALGVPREFGRLAIAPRRSRQGNPQCEGRDSNPRTSTGADLESAAVSRLGYPRTQSGLSAVRVSTFELNRHSSIISPSGGLESRNPGIAVAVLGRGIVVKPFRKTRRQHRGAESPRCSPLSPSLQQSLLPLLHRVDRIRTRGTTLLLVSACMELTCTPRHFLIQSWN